MSRHFCETLNLLVDSLGSEFRKANGSLNIAMIARAIRINQPTMQRMLNGQSKEPSGENADKLCSFFRVDRDQLVGRKPIPGIDDTNGVRDKSLQNVGPVHRKIGKIPLISFTQAGNWCDVVDPYELEDAEKWMESPIEHSDKAFMLRNQGSSMDDGTRDGYPDGVILQFEPEMEAMHGDDVVVRTPDGKTTFKRLQKTPEGVFLMAINPDFPNRIIEMPEDTVICGVCTGYIVEKRRHK